MLVEKKFLNQKVSFAVKDESIIRVKFLNSL